MRPRNSVSLISSTHLPLLLGCNYPEERTGNHLQKDIHFLLKKKEIYIFWQDKLIYAPISQKILAHPFSRIVLDGKILSPGRIPYCSCRVDRWSAHHSSACCSVNVSYCRSAKIVINEKFRKAPFTIIF